MKYFKEKIKLLPILLLYNIPAISFAVGETTIKNPLSKTDTIVELVNSLINVAIYIGIPVATLMMVYAGFKFVTAQGNEGELTEAKNILWNVVVGVAIILGAKGILGVIQQTIGKL